MLKRITFKVSKIMHCSLDKIGATDLVIIFVNLHDVMYL